MINNSVTLNKFDPYLHATDNPAFVFYTYNGKLNFFKPILFPLLEYIMVITWRLRVHCLKTDENHVVRIFCLGFWLKNTKYTLQERDCSNSYLDN